MVLVETILVLRLLVYLALIAAPFMAFSFLTGHKHIKSKQTWNARWVWGLPILIVVEELLMRVLPHFVVSLFTPSVFMYLIVVAWVSALLHYPNLWSAKTTLIGRAQYILFHAIAGIFFGWVYLVFGFVIVYVVHLAWDYILLSIWRVAIEIKPELRAAEVGE